MRQWRFIANQNSMFSGINDAGIETFTADLTRSLVRETIQNALDAAIPGYAGATRVEFSLFQLPVEEIPDVGRLRAAVTMCRDSNREEPDAYRFFARAAGTLDGSSIAVLRISDQGTVGLEGSDTCAKGTGWSRLVKESGSSNKGKDSGGSFGIGKSAAFACSDLRTVFYSSLDVQGLPSNIGVAKLISFQDPDLGWTTGVGYYSEDERYVAMRELAALHEGYRRKASGTDIYILGMHMDGDFKTAFIRAVLLDFMVSVVKGKLEVVIQDEQIDRGTLAQYMARLDPHESEDIKALLIYHHILTSPDPDILRIPLDSRVYGQRYGFSDGECTLYLKEGEGFGRKILITRSAGMRILEQDRISGSIEFYGVLIIDGEKMNETFKKMEVPSHDAWEPGRCREDREVCAGALRDLRDIGSLPSILRIIPLKDKKKGTMSVDTDSGEHITIGLSEDVFELYARLGKSTFRATAFSLVLLPALVVVLQRMYLMRDDESYTSMHWYQVIESILEEGRQPVETLDIQSDALLSVCQSIFADPISRSLRELDSYSEGMCE